ncbi:MAG: hypothetical protein KIT87_11385 [Anaerolineae bacterium]|nr:hypothetical protein [Anaerolineae bacterium]
MGIARMQAKTFIAPRGTGIARATEGATGVWHVETLLGNTAVRCLAVDPLDNQRVFAGTQGAGVLRSEDGGTTWQSAGLTGWTITAIAASPIRQGRLYAGAKPARLFVSPNGGATWTELTGFRRIPWRWLWLSPAERPFIGYVQAIALSPTDPQRIAVGIEAGATVLSVDDGQSWTGHRTGALRDCHSLTFHATRGEWLYEGGGTGGGHAFSRDGGETWSRTKQGLDCHYGWAVAADSERPEVHYLSASPGPAQAHSENNAQAGIFRHDGAHWQRLAGGLPRPLNHMPYALITDPLAPGHVYAGLSNGDVWHSADHGDHWQLLPLNLGGIGRSLVMLPRR